MKVAIMQPYFFPYFGYYQMLYNTDIFLSYDNVDYIQRGWINRNRILINGEPKYFTITIEKAPLGTKINEIKLKNYHEWATKFCTTLNINYSKAPHFETTYHLIKSILFDREYEYISEIALESVKRILIEFQHPGDIVESSGLKIPIELLSKEQKLEVCLEKLNADTIILPPGSYELYKNWKPLNINKLVMKQPEFKYAHFKNTEVENLSIIDVLMFNSIDTIKEHLQNINYQL